MHYALISKENNLKRKYAIAKAKERDVQCLINYLESKAIQWQFIHENVRYTMTCAMDTVLMTIFILLHQKVVSRKVLKDTIILAEVMKLINDGDHSRARYEFVKHLMTKTAPVFLVAKVGDNPFN